MHVKALIIDAKTLLTGSVNMTHNGLENNKEHLYRITDPSAVSEVMIDFEKEWAGAETVTQELIDDMLARHEKRASDRARSKSLSRGASRSLSCELDEVRK